ncbi:Transglutaminase-like superfamily protein [Chitinophaga terrae (ex Kim and Jung 2007)]|uniref:Transglutaminase-like superfamily protein n=1 Tax=Chitinophaga terrae (ex Kim and Jung 2007) TaxID=408074 RepID=A0A1H4DYA4_9BACT|nr:transglutaminase domain-containing protein [Chitinophaga terrae (ex Kim and Jung 2007)]MDQ0104976.1 hypothetical protein [Chitinophaga terrae (ex Kim and Jung 2007)]GEP91304.1 transglutaminase [Chitinophaga terrae (ex Kim and Jung 2007)]SEA77172.1 Transglutaminase-like superfamily protein [Chitinophaga terrae (ex Kim and Jung 2007)]
MAIDQSKYSLKQKILFNVLSLLTLLSFAPYINRFLPPIVLNGWQLDLIIAVAICVLILYFIKWLFRPIIIPFFLVVCCLVTITWVTKQYSLSNVLNDYKGMIQGNLGAKDSKQIDILSLYPRRVESYRDKTVRGIREKINFQDSVVRNFSVHHALDYFDEYYYKYGKITRFLSLFKYINGNFKYVLDSRRDEYFANPKETILNGLGGDCDDHSLLMASCMQSIGARCRIVLIKGHAYPELYCGDKNDFEVMKQAIVTLFPKPAVKEIYYHELKGEYWINLDYTARHPGGPYMNDKVYALIEL